MKQSNQWVLATTFAASLLLPSVAMAETTITWPTQLFYKSMNPAVVFDAETYVIGNLYETLFLYDNGEIKPRLAVKWEKSEGGKVWTVKLRQGVKFHDGSVLDSAAVKKSFEYTRDLGKGAGYLYGDLETVDTPDAETAVFKFKKPIAFDLVASGQYGSYVIGPAAIDNGDDWMNAGNSVGTGPYRLSKFETTKITVIEKFDDYWGGWTEGQVDRVIQPVVLEASTRVQMLKSGEADVADVPISQLKALAVSPDISVSVSKGWRNSQYHFNTQKYPTDNKAFREALTYLWDHDTVQKEIFQGYSTRSVGPVPASMWGHGSYQTGTFDPQKALELLKASGIPEKDWKIEAMYSNSNQEQIDAIELFQANAAAIGLTVELLPQQSSKTYLAKARSLATSANMHSMLWYPAYPTPSDWLYSQYKSREGKKGAGFNLAYYANPEFDMALAEAVDAEGISIEQATKAYKAAQDILMSDTPAIFFADNTRITVHSTKVTGFENSSNPAYETLFIYNLRK